MSTRPARLRRALLSALLTAVPAAQLLRQPVLADSSSAPVAANAASLTTGADIYTHICQGCHMPQGQGAKGAGFYPALAGDTALKSWQYPVLIVLGGRHGMPPFGLPEAQAGEIGGVHFSDEQIAAVVNYVRSSFGNKYRDQVSAAQVASLPHPGTPVP